MTEKKTQARTTVEYRGKEYPFYRTNRGIYDFENSGYTIDDIVKGKQTALLAQLYYQLKDCAKRVNNPITDSFEQFIDNSNADILSVFARLKEETDKLNPDSKKEAGNLEEN